MILPDVLDPLFSSLLQVGKGFNPHDYNAAFLDEKEILSKSNDGFCLTGDKSLSTELSNRNCVIIGQTGTGKSVTVLIPSILSMDCSLIINDPSGELYRKTAGFKSRSGSKVLVLDYSKPEMSVGYNPIERANNVSEISKVASTLIRASLGEASKDPFWTLQAVSLLVIPISLVKKMERKYQNLANVRRLLEIMTGDPKKMDKLMIKYGDVHLMNSYKSFVSMAPKTFSSVAATALAALTLFQDEQVAQVTAIDTLNMNRFRKEKVVLYIQNSTIDMKYYAPLTSIFAEQMFGHIMNSLPEKEDRDIYFLLDEASSLTLPSLPITIANIRKYNSGILLACQDYRQLVQNYGNNDAESIRTNCFSKVYFTGQSLQTAKELEALLGKYTYEEEGQRGKKNRALMTADEIRTMPVDKSLIVCGHHRPIHATMIPYYKNRKLLPKTVYACPDLKGEVSDIPVSFIPLS